MVIDIYTHIATPRFMAFLDKQGDAVGLLGRLKAKQSLYDLDVRFREMDRSDDYRQVISLPNPPFEELSGADDPTIVEACNDDLAELCIRHPERFAGFVAAVDLSNSAAAAREATRAVQMLGAKGVLIYTNVAGRPLDDPRYDDFLKQVGAMNAPIWLHPTRSESMPDYASEETSKYEMWWCFGWPYETTVAVTRLILSGLFDHAPDLQVITHHAAAMIPIFASRIELGLAAMGARTNVDDGGAEKMRRLKQPFIDYFRRNLYADTAMFGDTIGVKAALEFFGPERVVFASDSPFAPIEKTIQGVRNLDVASVTREKILSGNASKLLGS